jgi:hypothetical protein
MLWDTEQKLKLRPQYVDNYVRVSNMAKFRAHHPRSVKATARRVLKKKK